jgi:limonene-1,2-epoxide hydrolase
MSPIRMSKLESAIRVVLEFTEAFNRHDVEDMMECMGDDCVFESASPSPDGARYEGKASVAEYWRSFFRESPHAGAEIEEIAGLGLKCILQWRSDWLDGEGRKRHIRGVDVFQLKNGAICKESSYTKR